MATHGEAAGGSLGRLDILGQLPNLQIYTQLSFCFSMAGDGPSSRAAIVEMLTGGLRRLAAGFPWTAGQVVNGGAAKGNTGVFGLEPLEPTPRLTVKDARDALSMDHLAAANFPFAMLDESVVASRSTLPTAAQAAGEEPAPVLVAQATFVAGGLVLTFAANHGVMDMTGQAHLVRLLARACAGEPFTTDEVRLGNVDREAIIPLLDGPYQPGPEMDHQLLTEAAKAADPDAAVAPRCSWNYFIFSGKAVGAIKARAMEHGALARGGAFVSADDALSAFVWQSVMRARRPRLGPDGRGEWGGATFARAVDVRSYLGLPATYAGLANNMAFLTYGLRELVGAPLGEVALRLRRQVDPATSTLGYDTRSLATFLTKTADKSLVSTTAVLDLSRDLMLSSWAKVECYDLDFGLGLGKPTAVRRPQFAPVESLAYLLPRRPDGEIALAVCLRDSDLERLLADDAFGRCASHVP